MHIRFASGATVEGFCSTTCGNSRIGFFVDSEAGRIENPWVARLPAHLIREAEKTVPEWFSNSRRSIFERAAHKAIRRIGKANLIPAPRYTSPHQVYLEAIVDTVASRGDLPVDVTQARHTQELCTAVYEAAIQERRVSISNSTKWMCYGGIDKAAYKDRSRRHLSELKTLCETAH